MITTHYLNIWAYLIFQPKKNKYLYILIDCVLVDSRYFNYDPNNFSLAEHGI